MSWNQFLILLGSSGSVKNYPQIRPVSSVPSSARSNHSPPRLLEVLLALHHPYHSDVLKDTGLSPFFVSSYGHPSCVLSGLEYGHKRYGFELWDCPRKNPGRCCRAATPEGGGKEHHWKAFPSIPPSDQGLQQQVPSSPTDTDASCFDASVCRMPSPRPSGSRVRLPFCFRTSSSGHSAAYSSQHSETYSSTVLRKRLRY